MNTNFSEFVAVLIPHYNSVLDLKETIKSIDENEPLYVYIIDDGSTEKFTEQEIIDVAKCDVYFEFIYLEKNRGIEHALNEGLRVILQKGHHLIARLDCGDFCIKNRFFVQQKFMNEHPEIGLVGSFVDFINLENEHLFQLKLPVKDKAIRKKMYINCMFIHPTVIFRKEVVSSVGLYPTSYPAAEDYAFFFKILKKYKVENIPEVLVRCSINEKGISGLRRNIQVKSRIKVILDNFYLGFYPVYGLFRNLLLLFFPRRMTTTIKKLLKR